MRFGEALRARQIAGWTVYYCDYERLKRLITAERAFVEALEAQLDKVNQFSLRRLGELLSQFSVLQQQCAQLCPRGSESPNDPAGCGPSSESVAVDGTLPLQSPESASGPWTQPGQERCVLQIVPSASPAVFSSRATRDSMRTAFVELYCAAQKLESFLLINKTAFAKISKKFRKRKLAPGPPRPSSPSQVAPVSIQAAMATSPGIPLLLAAHTTAAATEAPVDTADQLAAVESSVTACLSSLAERVHELVEKVEMQFGETLYGASCTATEARAHLMIRQPDQIAGASGFLLGWRVGASTLLLLWLGWDLAIDERLRPDTYCEARVPGYTLWDDPALKVYHFASALLLLEWCWSGIMIVCQRSHINVAMLLELPSAPPGHRHQANLEAVTMHSMLFALNMLLFFKLHHGDILYAFHSDSLQVMNRALPVLTAVGCMVCLIHPWSQKRQLWVLLGSVLRNFCHVQPVRFVHTFFADWLTSLVKVFADIAQSVCFYTSGDAFAQCPQATCPAVYAQGVYTQGVLPVISSLPYLLRLLQCLRAYRDTHKRWPHLANGFKYCFALAIIVIGSTHEQWKQLSPEGTSAISTVWIVMYAISTLYTYTWDVFMDWGLSCRLGRDRRMISKDSWLVYRSAVVADVFLRFLWTLTLAPTSMPFGSFVHDRVAPYLSYLEICRRAMWSIFRVENEHLSNTRSYKGAETVPLHLEHPLGASADMRQRHSWLKVTLEVGAFIAVVLLVYAVSFATQTRNVPSNHTEAGHG